MSTTDMTTPLTDVVELETHANWTAADIGNPDDWTLQLTDTAAWFTDECSTIELAHSLGSGPFYLFIGGDNDYGSAIFRHFSTSATPPPSPPPSPPPPLYPPGAT